MPANANESTDLASPDLTSSVSTSFRLASIRFCLSLMRRAVLCVHLGYRANGGAGAQRTTGFAGLICGLILFATPVIAAEQDVPQILPETAASQTAPTTTQPVTKPNLDTAVRHSQSTLTFQEKLNKIYTKMIDKVTGRNSDKSALSTSETEQGEVRRSQTEPGSQTTLPSADSDVLAIPKTDSSGQTGTSGGGYNLFPSDAVVGFLQTTMVVDQSGQDSSFDVHLLRTGSYGENISVHWETKPLDASDQIVTASGTAGQDFLAASGQFTMGPNDKDGVIKLQIMGSQEWRGDRAFKIVLSNPVHASLNGDTLKITIRETRPKPQPVQVAKVMANVSNLDFGLIVSPTPTQAGVPVTQTQSPPRQIILENQGGYPAKINDIAFTGTTGATGTTGTDTASEWLFDARNCQELRELAPGKTCSISVNFTPLSTVQLGTINHKILIAWSSTSTTDITGSEQGNEANRSSGLINISVTASIRPPPVPFDPMAAERTKRLQERLHPQNSGIYNFRDDTSTKNNSIEYVKRDADYSSLRGWPKASTSTLPVDRTYMITTDRYIPCVLETAINSEVPGHNVVCNVESNVYGIDGRRVLIPSGTRITGDYQSLQKTGQSRLSIIWRRMIRPDGASIFVKGGFEGEDQSGKTGLPGEIDNRWWEKYGDTLFMTALSSGMAVAAGTTTTGAAANGTITNSGVQNAQQSGSQGLARITQQMLENSLDLRPVMNVAAGTRLIVRPLVDIEIKRGMTLGEAAIANAKKNTDAAADGANTETTAGGGLSPTSSDETTTTKPKAPRTRVGG